MRTQIGEIAGMLQEYSDEQTPLQKSLDALGRSLGIAALAICGFIFVFGVVRDTPMATLFSSGVAAFLTPATREVLVHLFMTAVGLAIAAVPEGLPAVVTICLALGMQRMIRRNALIRKLPAVETLGCATTICSDKTGTLTLNRMVVVQAWADGGMLEVTGDGYKPTGELQRAGEPVDPHASPATALLLHGALLCNDAVLRGGSPADTQRDGADHAEWDIVGDPTEGALVVLAAKAGLWRDRVEAVLPRVAEVPFDSDRKRMTTIHRVQDGAGEAVPPLLRTTAAVAFVKGAPDGMLPLCDHILSDGQVVALDEARRAEMLAANRSMAGQALRVLALAYRPLEDIPANAGADDMERRLVFLGLVGMIDPPRPEVKAAIAVARAAGLKTIMVTGDYKETAVAVGRDIGLLGPDSLVLSGAEIDALSADELAAMVDRVGAYTRVSPKNKVQIVDALRRGGHVVAMTGDGVNDAPALKRADIGIAMGITGTDVAKETADMVLTDDNYASIVSAIEEGRIIYNNIRKFVFYLISCNVGEILVIFGSMVAGLPLPLRPIQLLLLNLVTDGAPALALSLEKGDPDTMQRPPRPVNEPVINRDMQLGILVQSVVMTIGVMVAFLYGLNAYPGNLAAAQTIAFATLVTSELAARVHSALAGLLGVCPGTVLQPVDGARHAGVVRLAAVGGLRARPADGIRHRTADAVRLAGDAAALLPRTRPPPSCSSWSCGGGWNLEGRGSRWRRHPAQGPTPL